MPLRSKVIITCAVTGSIHTPTMSPYLPLTPDEVARDAIAAAEAGAAILHLHAREPKALEMTRDFIFRNTFADIEKVIKRLGEDCGTRFEHECYDVGHLYNLAHFVDRGLIKPPLFVQTIFGILGGIGADHENLVHMKRIADKLFGDEYAWSILAAGRHQMPFVTMVAIIGGK